MNIFIIEPKLTVKKTDNINLFVKTLREQLEEYITVSWVKEKNINQYKLELNFDSLVILFNDKDILVEKKQSVYNFLERAKKCNALIWPVAMDKDSRIPTSIVSEKQSYDVWEQLRCRNLSIDYLESIAKAFSRKIISRAMPTIYSEKGLIFISHRRLDGEEITAKLCDSIKMRSKLSNIFRDITEVQVGEEAQAVIDIAMEKSDAFIFIHTEKSAESDWIQKELRYALLRNIPILWIQIDNADIAKLKIIPTENPHLQYKSSDFEDDNKMVEITDEILQKVFEIVMSRNNKVFDFLDTMQNLFGEKMLETEKTELVYKLSVPRECNRYPQRAIRQYIQLYGRTPIDEDENKFKEIVNNREMEYDSAVILTDRIVKKQCKKEIVRDSFEDFYYYWNEYLEGKRENKDLEIIIAGAFPDGDEICKQSLTDAIVVFAKSILREGYRLTFGSHPTFQELFFEIARETCPKEHMERVRMYISKWFEDKYINKKEYFSGNVQLVEVEKEATLEKSLTRMRKEMIQRGEVAAIVCLGGKIKENKKEEGIREEIKLAQEFNIPIFLVGTVGGCSSEVALEFKNCKWKGLNKASLELNKMFMESLDYFMLSQKMLQYLGEERK